MALFARLKAQFDILAKLFAAKNNATISIFYTDFSIERGKKLNLN